MAAKTKTAKIRKFSRSQILFHWVFGISWLLLALTGSIFLWRPNPQAVAWGLGPLLQGSTGQIARTIHRIAAIGLAGAPLIWLLGDVKSLVRDLPELFAFGWNDLKYMLIAPLYYTVGRPHLPPQGKYNGGHKTNFYVVILTWVVFLSTGATMWFGRGSVSPETFKTMQMLHSMAFWGGISMVALHVYLTAIHPFTSRSLSSMLQGFMDLKYAKAEHGLWVDQQIASGKADIIEEGRAS